jgi:hypothetical protein
MSPEQLSRVLRSQQIPADAVRMADGTYESTENGVRVIRDSAGKVARIAALGDGSVLDQRTAGGEVIHIR